MLDPVLAIVGAKVRALPPFDVAFPDTYEIEGLSEVDANTYRIAGGRDFDQVYLELVAP